MRWPRQDVTSKSLGEEGPECLKLEYCTPPATGLLLAAFACPARRRPALLRLPGRSFVAKAHSKGSAACCRAPLSSYTLWFQALTLPSLRRRGALRCMSMRQLRLHQSQQQLRCDLQCPGDQVWSTGPCTCISQLKPVNYNDDDNDTGSAASTWASSLGNMWEKRQLSS